MRFQAAAIVMLLALGGLAGCAGDAPPAPAGEAMQQAGTPDGRRGRAEAGPGAAGSGAAAAAADHQGAPLLGADAGGDKEPRVEFGPPRDLQGLHHVIEVAPGVFSGSEPTGEAGFAELARLGVRSILSVDGGRPDADAARAHGIRYAHVPVRYSEITLEQRLAIARAMRDLEGPVYVHCHHGLHRGPAAAAAGLVSLGALTAEEGVAFMRHAGTSSKYPGLYQCVNESAPLTSPQIELVAMPGEVAEVPAFAAAMAQVGRAEENLVLIAQAGWSSPMEHPDLAAASEAGQLADVLRVLTERREPADQPGEFYEWMAANARLAQELEDAVMAGEGAEGLSARLKAVGASCAACHAVYRNE
jgi:protein tyrosine phosphatase (PTP) superfamily phosphohydrolase (DUF442 family)